MLQLSRLASLGVAEAQQFLGVCLYRQTTVTGDHDALFELAEHHFLQAVRKGLAMENIACTVFKHCREQRSIAAMPRIFDMTEPAQQIEALQRVIERDACFLPAKMMLLLVLQQYPGHSPNPWLYDRVQGSISIAFKEAERPDSLIFPETLGYIHSLMISLDTPPAWRAWMQLIQGRFCQELKLTPEEVALLHADFCLKMKDHPHMLSFARCAFFSLCAPPPSPEVVLAQKMGAVKKAMPGDLRQQQAAITPAIEAFRAAYGDSAQEKLNTLTVKSKGKPWWIDLAPPPVFEPVSTPATPPGVPSGKADKPSKGQASVCTDMPRRSAKKKSPLPASLPVSAAVAAMQSAEAACRAAESAEGLVASAAEQLRAVRAQRDRTLDEIVRLRGEIVRLQDEFDHTKHEAAARIAELEAQNAALRTELARSLAEPALLRIMVSGRDAELVDAQRNWAASLEKITHLEAELRSQKAKVASVFEKYGVSLTTSPLVVFTQSAQ